MIFSNNECYRISQAAQPLFTFARTWSTFVSIANQIHINAIRINEYELVKRPLTFQDGTGIRFFRIRWIKNGKTRICRSRGYLHAVGT